MEPAKPLIGRKYPRKILDIILAGGLDKENVAKAIRISKPDAVDVNSGVESRPGIKNHGVLEKIYCRRKASR